MKQKSNETSSSRWEIKFELTAPLWILINPELVRRRTQTRAAKSKRRSRFSWLEKKKGIYHSRDLRMFWTEPSRTTRNTTTSSKSNLDSANFHRSRDPRGPEGGTWIRNYATGGRARHACTIRVGINPSYDVAWKSNGGGPSLTNFLFLFFLFFWPPTPFRLVVRGFQEAFVSFYKGIRFERVVRLVGRTR